MKPKGHWSFSQEELDAGLPLFRLAQQLMGGLGENIEMAASYTAGIEVGLNIAMRHPEWAAAVTASLRLERLSERIYERLDNAIANAPVTAHDHPEGGDS